MRKVIGFLCVLAAVLVVVLMMYSQVQPASPDRLIISSIGVDTAGGTVRFRVTRIALYTPRQAPIQKIFGDESGSYLNLITCAGDWIASQHQTTLRLVVYTTLVR